MQAVAPMDTLSVRGFPLRVRIGTVNTVVNTGLTVDKHISYDQKTVKLMKHRNSVLLDGPIVLFDIEKPPLRRQQ